MARLLTFLSFKKLTIMEDWITVYVPLSPKEIPRDQLEYTIRAWLHPELCWVKGYLDLESAIGSQQHWQGCERYPHVEGLRVVVEIQVPLWAVQLQDDELRIDLNKADEYIQISNIYVTAKCMAGFSEEESLPGDLPFNGTVYEVIVLNDI